MKAIKSIKVLLYIMTVLILFPKSTLAEINFKQVKTGSQNRDTRRVFYTGRGYFKDDKENSKVWYYSTDKVTWNMIPDIYHTLAMSLFGDGYPRYKVIETDDNFIFCDSLEEWGKGSSYGRNGRIIVTDKNYNLIKEIKTDKISDFSYIDGVYYINQYLEYVGSQYQYGVADVVTKQTSYYSTDLENWTIYKEDGGIPIINDGKEIFLKNNLLDASKLLDPKDFRVRAETAATVNIMKNGDVAEEISYESADFTDIVQVRDYLFAIPRSLNVYEDKKDYFYVSKDGIYFTKIVMPDAVIDTEDDILTVKPEEIYGIAELENGDLNIDVRTNTYSHRWGYEFTVEDLENTMRTGDVYVQFQDKILGFETPPVIEDGSTLVPMRFLFEQMGADVEWNGETQTATATLDNTAITFAIDNTNAEVNNTPATMDVPARLINDKTMVPLRFLSENLGYKVDWDEASRTAIIE